VFFLWCFFASFFGGAAAKVVFLAGGWLVVGGWLVLLNFRG
jgi:hypothetical protein